MGKSGPCRHCGVTSTPLWRNGPPDKPVLCNACGSRWRTKGSLTNYTPLHSREAFELEEAKVPKVKSIFLKTKDQKLHKKKVRTMLDSEQEMQYCDQNYRKIVEGGINNRSSSGPTGSAVSYSESCAHFGTNDASDMTGSAQSNVLDPFGSSKKRTFVTRPKPSRVEELTKELYSIFQEQQSCNLSGCSEDDLLYDTVMPMDSSEIGYGSILIRQPYPKSVEEESEASSLPLEKKVFMKSDAYAGTQSFPVKAESRIAESSNFYTDKLKKSTTELVQENTKRSKVPHEKHRMLQDRDSPLVTANLHDIANFEAFVKFLTFEEQQQLMKLLPLIDSSRPPESLRSMFKSRQFLEAMSNFQQLLQEGVFDLSFTLAIADDRRNLKRKILNDLKKSEWIDYHKSLKDRASKKMKIVKELNAGNDKVGPQKMASVKRACDSQPHDYSELESATKSPKRVCTFGAYYTTFTCKDEPKSSNAGLKLTNDIDNLVEYEGTCSTPRRPFESPQDSSSMQAPLHFSADSFDQDLLVEVPSSSSFAEAELLYPRWKDKMPPNVSYVDSGFAEGEESRSSFPSSSFSLAKSKNL